MRKYGNHKFCAVHQSIRADDKELRINLEALWQLESHPHKRSFSTLVAVLPTCAAPVIILGMKSLCPGASSNVTIFLFVSNRVIAMSIVMPLVQSPYNSSSTFAHFTVRSPCPLFPSFIQYPRVCKRWLTSLPRLRLESKKQQRTLSLPLKPQNGQINSMLINIHNHNRQKWVQDMLSAARESATKVGEKKVWGNGVSQWVMGNAPWATPTLG